MKNIAIIPARSGSKTLKDKNVKLLYDKPLMAYSIKAALNSRMFDTVHVSTDSKRYAEISESFGADVPFLRSIENSSDTASSWDAMNEVLNNYSKLGKTFDNVMLLQPTSPLRTDIDIIEAFKLMNDKDANAVVSVNEVEEPPMWHNTLPEDGDMTHFIRDDSNNKRRQDADTYYRINGAIFLAKTDYFLEDSNIYRDSCFAYIMDKRNSIDIDDKFDFIFAETLLMQENGF